MREAQSRTIGGYAAKFNTFSENLGGFTERIAPSFFNKSRGDGWPGVLARYNHDDNMPSSAPPGRTRFGWASTTLASPMRWTFPQLGRTCSSW